MFSLLYVLFQSRRVTDTEAQKENREKKPPKKKKKKRKEKIQLAKYPGSKQITKFPLRLQFSQKRALTSLLKLLEQEFQIYLGIQKKDGV